MLYFCAMEFVNLYNNFLPQIESVLFLSQEPLHHTFSPKNLYLPTINSLSSNSMVMSSSSNRLEDENMESVVETENYRRVQSAPNIIMP